MIDEVKTPKPKNYLVAVGKMTLLVSYAITGFYQLHLKAFKDKQSREFKKN
ncbi:hypothetical protein [Nostoc sp. C117]|uniref:hypothetical protein n=1 Tax=Nostoc sp. C117 TaxID=3349875 RepID=UPI00370DAB2C